MTEQNPVTEQTPASKLPKASFFTKLKNLSQQESVKKIALGATALVGTLRSTAQNESDAAVDQAGQTPKAKFNLKAGLKNAAKKFTQQGLDKFSS